MDSLYVNFGSSITQAKSKIKMVSNIEREPLTAQLLLPETEEGSSIDNGDSAVTPLLLFSVFIAVCGCFACGTAVGYSSPVESAVMEELGLSTAEYSLFGSMLTVGGILASIVSGRITDMIGRRGAIGLADTLSLIGWITISISKAAWSLDVGRFFVGTSLGLSVYAVPVYIAEITPKNLRGGLIMLTQLIQSSGIVVMFFVGSLIPWRILVLIGIVPCAMQLLGVFMIPESPRFLAKLGRGRAYENVLQRLRGDNIDISQEVTDIEELNEQVQQIPQVNFLGLFQKKYARSLIVVFGLLALAGFGGPTGGVTFYASSILESAGFSSSIGSIGLPVIQIPSAAIGVYLIDKYGRRPLLMISASTMVFCCFLVGFMFLLREHDCLENLSPYFIVLSLWGYSGAYTLGMGPIPYVIMAEIFPMNVKGSAGSLAGVVGGMSIGLLSYTFNFVIDWSYPGAFFILAWINALALLFIVKLVPETKTMSLEEIQESLAHGLEN